MLMKLPPNEYNIKEDMKKQKLNITQEGLCRVYNNVIHIDTPFYEFILPYDELFQTRYNRSPSASMRIGLNNASDIIVHSNKDNKETLQQMTPVIEYNTYNTYLLNNARQNQYISPQQEAMLSQQYQNRKNPEKKSMLLAVLLHVFILPGLGYAYVGKWDKFFLTLVGLLISTVLSSFIAVYVMSLDLGQNEIINGICTTISTCISMIPLGIWAITLLDSTRYINDTNNQ